MGTPYTTGQGELVDMICQKHYGRTAGVTEAVLAANPGLAGLGPVLPFATVVILQALAPASTQRKLVSLFD